MAALELLCPSCGEGLFGEPGRTLCAACGVYGVASDAARAGQGDPLLGQRVLGRFVVLGLRAFGATAAVYDAYDAQADDPAVLKIVRAERSARSGDLAREARILGALTLAEVPRLRAHGEHALAQPTDDAVVASVADVLAMDLAAGGPLSLTPEPSASSARRLAETALPIFTKLHAQGVAHGDVKPGHLFVDRGGSLVGLVDFGSATAPSAREPISRTPAWAPPDDLPGPRFDLWALGKIVDRVARGGASQPAWAPADPALARFVTRCLAPSPGSRPIDAEEGLAILGGTA
jgi:serine/threonine protein kinase